MIQAPRPHRGHSTAPTEDQGQTSDTRVGSLPGLPLEEMVIAATVAHMGPVGM